VQGKGVRNTYWLVGKDGFEKRLPVPPEQSGLVVPSLSSTQGRI